MNTSSRVLGRTLARAALLVAAAGAQAADNIPLTYYPDGALANPVVYSNDGDNDVRPALAYVASLASAGKINLVGIVGDGAKYKLKGSHYGADCKNPAAPFDCSGHAENLFQQYEQFVAMYQRSGMTNIPSPTRGPHFVLEKPANGRFESTQPTCVSFSRSSCQARGSDAARMIVDEAKKASTGIPLVVLIGGGLTAVAEAYTLDATVADRIFVIAHVGGEWPVDGKLDTPAYNDYVDLWAMGIVVSTMRVLIFPEPVSEQTRVGPRMTDADIEALLGSRDIELFRFFLRQRQYTNQTVNKVKYIPSDRQYTGDGSPGVFLALPETGEFVTSVRRGHFSGWRQLPGENPDSDGVNQYPIVSLSDLQSDRVWVVMGGLPDASRSEALRAFADPAAFGGLVTTRAPWGGCSGATGQPTGLPATLAAIDFDWGGEAVALHEEEMMHWPMYRLWATKEVPLKDAAGNTIGNLVDGTEKLLEGAGGCASGSSYALTNFVAGEYREYTVTADVGTAFDLSVVARSATGGAVRLEVREANADETPEGSSGVVTIPSGATFATFSGGTVTVPAGTHRLRLLGVSGAADIRDFTLSVSGDD